jgi:TolB-like protein/Tfp pilus assembly protein PilF
VIAQVAGLVFDSINAPDWVMQALLFVLGLGFIIAIIISWAYELTPEGLKKDADVSPDESIANHTGKKLDYITITAALIVLGLFIYQKLMPVSVVGVADHAVTLPDRQKSTVDRPVKTDVLKDSGLQQVNKEAEDKSIAVLPFADMSQEGDQEYFADGISEEILNVLVRIPNLKVAGRTSSFSYKGKNEDLRKIGESLNVNHILEGSVRRSNTTLRITTQLIRSDDGFHLWSETYDREMADIFDIQDEIAKAVADQMVISLGLEVKTSEPNRTTDLVVYEDYLKAKQLFIKRGRENLDAALELVNNATNRDPNYAPAWTLKAYIYSIYDSYVSNEEKKANHKEWDAIRKSSAEHALQLDPQSAEAYVVLGNAYMDEFKFMQAYENYEKAIALAPDNPVILDTIAQEIMGLGYFEKARMYSEKAISIDPLVAIYRNTLGNSLTLLNRDEKAIENFEKSIQLDPTLPWPHNNLQWLFFNPKDIERFKTISQLRLANVSATADSGWVSVRGLELANNEVLLSDKEKVKALARESDGLGTRYLLTAFLSDSDSLIELLAGSWESETRRAINLFLTWQQANIYDKKRWKEQVKKDGVLALWQAKGFPTHCKPLGEDDFECVQPNGGR